MVGRLLLNNLYLLEPNVTVLDMFAYDSAVVVATSASQAAKIHPILGIKWDGKEVAGWPDSSKVDVELLGTAADTLVAGTTVCAG